MLFFVAKDYYSGNGEIMDVGAFLGTSSFCLAKGLFENPVVGNKGKRIHAYDAFVPWKEPAGTFDDTIRLLENDFKVTLVNGSFVGSFLDNTKEYQDGISVVQGDILVSKCDRGVEILFIDICKELAIQSHLLHEFYPNIQIDGLVIHQDYHHALLPWIHVVQERLSEYFEMVVVKASYSAVFMLKKNIPISVLEECAAYPFDVSEEIVLFNRALARIPVEQQGDVEIAKAVLLLNHGMIDEADEIYSRQRDRLEGGLADKQLQTNVWAYEWHRKNLIGS